MSDCPHCDPNARGWIVDVVDGVERWGRCGCWLASHPLPGTKSKPRLKKPAVLHEPHDGKLAAIAGDDR